MVVVEEEDACSVQSKESVPASPPRKRRGRPPGATSKRTRRLDVNSLQPMDRPVGDRPHEDRQHEDRPREQEMEASVLCTCNSFTNLFVSDLPEEIDSSVVFACYRHLPSVQWDRKEFMSCVENICRFHKQTYGNCLWGNRFVSDFTVGGERMKAEALLECVNRFQCLSFEHDGPQLLFTVFSQSVDMDPRLVDVIKVVNAMRNGGKTGCLTTCCVPTDRTSLSYRGDNSSNKAKQVNIKVERQGLEDLNSQLYDSMNPVSSPYISHLCQDDGINLDFVKAMFLPSRQASSMNYHLRINNLMENESCAVIGMSCLETRVEMRLFECERESKRELWVAQSVSVRTVAGVNPFSVFLETMTMMSKEVQSSVLGVLDSMVKCLNRGSALSHDDMHSMLQWLTAPSFLPVMLSGWGEQNGAEIVSSDIPVANEAFVKIILSYVNKELSSYVKEVDTKMNYCKQSTKTKQVQVVAKSMKMFRGAYIHQQDDGWNLVGCPLPPASFSYGVHMNVDWVKENVSVTDLSKNCVFATILNVICNPHMILSDTFLNEMKEMRSSLKSMQALESTEGKWVMYMMDNVSEYVSNAEHEGFNRYLRFIGKHDPTNRMFGVLMDLSFKTKQYVSVFNTVNLIRYQLDAFLKCYPTTLSYQTSRMTSLLRDNPGIMEHLASQIETYREVFPEPCMSSFTNLSIQSMLSSVNKVFRFKNSNLNLLWVLITSGFSFALPNEPAWATSIMLVDSACQTELIVQDKGRVKILGISGSKRDSTGFNFVLGCFKQLVTACSLLCGVEEPNVVVTNSTFTDGKKKRMGLTVGFLNNKTICEESTTNLADYGAMIFIPEDSHKLLADTGMAKNFLRDACVKRSGFRVTENFNMKLILMEEPRIVLMATNKKESEQGDVFSMAARLRFWPSAVPDELVPLNIDEPQTDLSEFKTSVAKVKMIKSLEMSLNAKFTRLCTKEQMPSRDSLDFNHSKIMQNLPLAVALHLTSQVLQVVTMSGFRLYCNESMNVSRSIMHEINNFVYMVIGPFLSADMNDEDRFIRKQEGLMLSHAVPMHAFCTVYKTMLASVLMEGSVDIDRVVNESVMQLLVSDIDTHVIFSSYCTNLTFETVMFVLFRSVIRLVEFPTGYSLQSLITLVRNRSMEGMSTEDKRGLSRLKQWINSRLRYLVTMRDLNQKKAREEVHDLYGKLGLLHNYDSSLNRSLFITSKDLYAASSMDEEAVDKNMWIPLQKFIIMLPEIQNSFKSFCLRRDLVTADLLCHLFSAKKIDRRCLGVIFQNEDLHFVDVLGALGVDPTLIPRNWATLSLHNTLRDEGNNNSNVFNMVQVGTNGCCLAVNMMALVLLGPLFHHNRNILHLLQQKETACNLLEQAFVHRIPRAYWPNDTFSVVQVNHTGKWVSHRLPRDSGLTYFSRVTDLHWNGHSPMLRTRGSCMLPFCLEEVSVCGPLLGLVRRMRDGMNLRDEPFTFACYMAVVSKTRDMGPWIFSTLSSEGQPYVFTSGKEWFILSFEGSDHCRWRSFDVVVGRMKLARDELYERGDIQTVIMQHKAFPVPLAFKERMVHTSHRFLGFYEGGRDFCDFGKVKEFDAETGTYLIEAYLRGTYEVTGARVHMHLISEVLLPDLFCMGILFDSIPDMGFFQPTEGTSLVRVYNVVDLEPTVVVPIVPYRVGFYDDHAGSMFLEVSVSALVNLEDVEESQLTPFIAFNQKT